LAANLTHSVAPAPPRSLKPSRLARLTALSRAVARAASPPFGRACAREGGGGPEFSAAFRRFL